MVRRSLLVTAALCGLLAPSASAVDVLCGKLGVCPGEPIFCVNWGGDPWHQECYPKG